MQVGSFEHTDQMLLVGRNGASSAWEGYGSCGFHTTDITYQGSFGILGIVPEPSEKQMEMGAKSSVRTDVCTHFFTIDLSAVDDGYDRVDMNPQFVLLVCKDYSLDRRPGIPYTDVAAYRKGDGQHTASGRQRGRSAGS